MYISFLILILKYQDQEASFTSRRDESSVPIVPRNHVEDDERDDDGSRGHRPEPEEKDSDDVVSAPEATEARCPRGVQIVLEHHVRHEPSGEQVTQPRPARGRLHDATMENGESENNVCVLTDVVPG